MEIKHIKELMTAMGRTGTKRLLLKKEGFIAKAELDDNEIQYLTFNEQASKQKQKLANRLKARGFSGDVIAKLIF